jgi:PAP2 superfamily protein
VSNVAPLRAPRSWRRGARELALVGVAYAAYDFSRFLVQGQQHSAFVHAMKLMHLEQALDVAWEQTVNQAISAHRLLAVPADYMYATLHYIVTPVVLVWLWRRHRGAYPRARTTLVVATILALIGFTLLPVAPPRMLPGFVDTMARYADAGWWSQAASAPRGVGQYTNQFAAMPSLHVGWALWCGWQVYRHARRAWVRGLGVLYPVLTSVVVIATGNHYLLDAFAGVAVVVLAGGLVRLATYLLRKRQSLPTIPAQPASVDLRDARDLAREPDDAVQAVC